MDENQTVELLTTDHCTLCEQALDLLLAMPELAPRQLVTTDIIYDEELLANYGEQIPVLRCGGSCLVWPFDRAGVNAWLGSE